MAGIIQGIREKLGIGGGRRKKQLEGLEERQTNPGASEKVVVRPDKRVKKKKKVIVK